MLLPMFGYFEALECPIIEDNFEICSVLRDRPPLYSLFPV